MDAQNSGRHPSALLFGDRLEKNRCSSMTDTFTDQKVFASFADLSKTRPIQTPPTLKRLPGDSWKPVDLKTVIADGFEHARPPCAL